MPELRKDYVLNRYVIIATERSKRPHQFTSEPQDKHVDKCSFCPGNESETPPEIGRWPPDGDWQMRWFPNRFPAAGREGHFDLRTDNEFFTFASAYGQHEVIVETRDHELELADLSVEQISNLLSVYSARIEELKEIKGVKYVSVFKNQGRAAGTSIIHSHSQAIALNIIPWTIVKKEKASLESCPYCKIIQIEKNSLRQIHENDNTVCFAPYASRFPLETWIFPKKHVMTMNDFSEYEFLEMSETIKLVLGRLKTLNAPYNMYLHYGIEAMHFHVVIAPRVAKWAGFEHSTGIIINSMSPERAAEFYRDQNC